MIFKKIILATDNISDTKQFYSDILGCELLEDFKDFVSFQIGHTVLAFKQSASPINPIYHFACNVPGNLFSSAFNWINSRLDILPFDEHGNLSNFRNWNANSFYFFDNQRNVVEFISHFDLPDSEEKIFAPSRIRGINEIGLPAEDVPATCSYYERRFGIPKFHKGPFMPEFAVLGEENAMLIITKAGRHWLPTQIPAQPFSINIEGVMNDKKFKIEL